MNRPPNPWQIAAEDFPEDGYSSDQLEFLVGYAVLAPSNYNTQPWLFRINAADLEIHADRHRAIRVVDPYDRELTISCGAALFNVRVAAEYFGHQYTLEILPDPADKNLMARLHFGLRGDTGTEDIVLFHAITKRHTNRQPFRPDPVPPEILAELQAAAAAEHAWLEVVEDESARAAIAELVVQTDRVQWADRHFRDELARWMRPRGDLTPDGIPAHDLGVKDWMSFAGAAMVRTFHRGGGQAARDRDIAEHSPVLAVLGTETEDWASWLAAGQALQHVLLTARSEEVWGSFLCQPIEVPELRNQVAAMFPRGGFPQVLLRLGYGPEVPPAPRRPPRDLLMRRQHGHA
jgi:nitroreductase